MAIFTLNIKGMRKLVFLFIMLATSLNAQVYQNEVKLNVVSLLLGNPDLSYEYLLSDRSGVGIFANVNVDDYRLWDYGFMAGPYYRFYTGKKYASGFFFEGGLTVFGERYAKDYYYDPVNNTGYTVFAKEVGFGPSLTIGGKIMMTNTAVFEFFGGIGRNFRTTDYSSDIFGRFGISIGKRF